jgi:cob(I)alamin adenosyltransferase
VKIYTKTGDEGKTSLLGGTRVPKDDDRIEAYGTVDELNASIGVVRALWLDSPLDGLFETIQNDLFDVGAHLAAAEARDRFPGVAPEAAGRLEEAIDAMESDLEPLRAFILPGGSPAAAELHVARTVCRRAERRVVALAEKESVAAAVIVYLNRLSDFLFVAARTANRVAGVEDVVWKK